MVEHKQDEALSAAGGVAKWAILDDNMDSRDMFSQFRIFQCGTNATNTHRLELAGIELYGVAAFDAGDQIQSKSGKSQTSTAAAEAKSRSL